MASSLAAVLHALLHSLIKAMAFVLLCFCGCCLRSHKRALHNNLLPVKQSASEASSAGLPSTDDDIEPRIVVFIDDLDRCKPTKIIEVGLIRAVATVTGWNHYRELPLSGEGIHL